jgi:hypothetical protein
MSNIIQFPKGYQQHDEKTALMDELKQRASIYFSIIAVDMKEFHKHWENEDFGNAFTMLERGLGGYLNVLDEIKHMADLQNS